MNDQKSDTTPYKFRFAKFISAENRAQPTGAVDVALARAGVYRWFSRVFVDPNDRGSAPHARQALFRKLGLDAAWATSGVSQDHLVAEFPQLFSHNLTPDCPPYETQYGASHIFWQSQQLADIAGFYRAFGVEVSGTTHERADHLAVELEFMGYLCAKEARALEHGQVTQAEICRDAQAKFLKDHLGRWVKAFGARVKAKLPQSAYARLMEALVHTVESDYQRFDVHPEPMSFDAASQAETPLDDGCLSCGGPTTCAGSASGGAAKPINEDEESSERR